MEQHLAEDLDRLLTLTSGCRPDMHEPDEQDLKLIAMIGSSLDNAFGESVTARAVVGGYQEAVVVLRRVFYGSGEPEHGREQNEVFNLANLIALARMARRS